MRDLKKKFKIFCFREIKIFLTNSSQIFFLYLSSIILIAILFNFSGINHFLKGFEIFSLTIFFLIFTSGQFLVSKFQIIDESENIFENYISNTKHEIIFLFVRFFGIFVPFFLIFCILGLIFWIQEDFSWDFLPKTIFLIFSSKIIFFNMIILFMIGGGQNSRKIKKVFFYIMKIILTLINIPGLILGLSSENFLPSKSIALLASCFFFMILNYALISNFLPRK
jgi:hypothetical protein